jgi:hypothetical protein
MNRYSGSKNYLYLGELGEEVSVAGALAGELYFKIIAKGSVSAFPSDAPLGAVVYNKPAIVIKEGDKVRPFKLSKIGFCTNVPQSAQKDKSENTTQIDSAKSYEEGDKPDISGNIDGYFTDDPHADLILNRFFVLVDDDGVGGRIFKPVTTGPLHFFLGRHETTAVGEKDVMEYMPAIIDSLTADKPMSGPQTFNFNYSVIGSEQPLIYRRKVTV